MVEYGQLSDNPSLLIHLHGNGSGSIPEPCLPAAADRRYRIAFRPPPCVTSVSPGDLVATTLRDSSERTYRRPLSLA